MAFSESLAARIRHALARKTAREVNIGKHSFRPAKFLEEAS